ncbi:UBX domain-containing protein 6 [Klebsormidium nitens]|uniref:UBX domain-containing protein 6 n=1 Tax=Klebsormidium nitens TaxID=105231 RepID=A0A1Y1IHK6_KLENI|nr:UBX domain-containing protein 6 [Klebsormidium nitens]|eukprot:GAQ89562.1 UBX domain-containing protein 6 [Klebsormidium nitens]
MDDLGKKLKSLSNPFKTKFKGQGQKLGGGDDDGEAAKPKAPGGVPRTGPAAARNLLNQRLQQEELLKRQEQERRELQRQRWAQDNGAGPTLSQDPQSQPGPSTQARAQIPPAPSPTSSSPKLPAQSPRSESGLPSPTNKSPQPSSTTTSKKEAPPTDFDPFKPFMGSGRALEARAGPGEESSTSGNAMDIDAQAGADELHTAVGLLVSDPSSRPATEILSRLLGNIVANPSNEKFRRVRLSNPKIAETVGKAPGGIDLLQAVGFEIREEEDADGKKEPWAVLGSASPEVLEGVKSGLDLLDRGLASQPIRITPGSLVKKPEVLEQERLRAEQERAQRKQEPEVVKPLDRQLKVFLPASENTAARIEVPDTFYKLSPSEVRAEAAARKKALENSQLLIPKSFREKQAQQARENFKAAMIRVQFPDGMVLQGVFSPMEATTAIYEFVAEALKNPAQTFHLVYSYPTKNPIIPAVPNAPGSKVPSLLDADLVPSGLVKYRGLDNDTTPFVGLRDDLVLSASSL